MARRVGVVASDFYSPATYVSQASLEKYDGIAEGKYQIGLGQNNMAFTGAGEDINSMCMSALTNLMEKYGLDYKDIGRLEVGTETILDKSKSTKTTLMQQFYESGNTDVLGVTNINACYGGTAALFNTIDWMESSAWDGRYGVVLAGDIAVYERGPARPTGGAGVVALLIGPNAPLVFENNLRSSHFEDVYDFYKPSLSSEYPAVDGHLSNACYLRAVDKCYELYASKFQRATGEAFSVFGDTKGSAQQFLFHQPYTKLVQKSFGRLLFNDVRLGKVQDTEIASTFEGATMEETYTNRDLDKACVKASGDLYKNIVFPHTYAGRNIGNSYAGSLYFGLLSLIANSKDKSLKDDRVVMFSYGSGLAATMFSARVEGSLEEQRTTCNLVDRLENQRVEISPELFSDALLEREEYYTATKFEIQSTPENIAPGAFHLAAVDDLGRRSYARAPMEMAHAIPSAARAYSTSTSASFKGQAARLSAGKFPLGMVRKMVLRR